MPGFLDRFRRSEGTRIWYCEPLVVAHPEEGIIFSGPAEVEYKPNDRSGKTGWVKVIRDGDRWAPELTYSQRIETLQTFDLQVKSRPGAILIGEDEAGEPSTWYTDGEADRYLMMPPDQTRQSEFDTDELALVLATPVDRSTIEMLDPRLVHIVREDGYCPASGPTKIKISPTQKPPVLEHWTAMLRNDDGTWPELYVLDKQTILNGAIVSGIDGLGVPATWYLDAAADEYLARNTP